MAFQVFHIQEAKTRDNDFLAIICPLTRSLQPALLSTEVTHLMQSAKVFETAVYACLSIFDMSKEKCIFACAKHENTQQDHLNNHNNYNDNNTI